LAPSPDARAPEERACFSKKKKFPRFLESSFVFLLDPIAKLLQAGEQRGMAVHEEDRLLLRLAAARDNLVWKYLQNIVMGLNAHLPV